MSVQLSALDEPSFDTTKVNVRLEVLDNEVSHAEKFIENFNVLAETAGGIDELRGLVLHLAIRGRLLTESPDALEDTPKTDDLIVPFGLPRGWVWRRVDEAGDLKLGRQRSPENHSGPNMRPYLRVANVLEARIDTSHVLEMNFDPHEAPRFLLEPNDILLNEGQSFELVGRPAIYRGEVPGACFQNSLIRFRPRPNVVPEFALVVFRAYMRTGRFRQEAKQTTNIAHLTLGRLRGVEFPLPPVAEQKRIVAKVDQLMALCDEFEARLTKKRETGARLTKSALEALTSAQGQADFDAAWKRVLGNFNVLMAGSTSIEPLRQTILWLGTHGRLSQRHINEETGGELVEKILVANRMRWETLKLKEMTASGCLPSTEAWKSKYIPASPAGMEDDLVSALPAHWSAASLQELSEVIDPNPSHRYPNYTNGVIPLLSTREFRGRDGWDATGANVPLVPASVHFEQVERCQFSSRDLIMARKGRLGLARHIPPLEAFVFSHTVFVIKPAREIDHDFLLWYLRLDRVIAWLRGQMNDNTGVPTLGKSTTERLPVPVPPLGEQKRIVAKLEHLMKVCDDLEDRLRQAEAGSAKMVEAVVGELLA